MTETEWLATTNPKPLLTFLQGNASDRKLRLFACGCCRLVWDRLVNPRSREAVLASEAFADGIGSVGDLAAQIYWAESAALAIDSKLERYRREQYGIEQGWIPEEDRLVPLKEVSGMLHF